MSVSPADQSRSRARGIAANISKQPKLLPRSQAARAFASKKILGWGRAFNRVFVCDLGGGTPLQEHIAGWDPAAVAISNQSARKSAVALAARGRIARGSDGPDMKRYSASVEGWRASATLDFLMPRHSVAKFATETRRRHSPQDIRCHPQFAFVIVLHARCLENRGARNRRESFSPIDCKH
jgi:hypothetical protein